MRVQAPGNLALVVFAVACLIGGLLMMWFASGDGPVRLPPSARAGEQGAGPTVAPVRQVQLMGGPGVVAPGEADEGAAPATSVDARTIEGNQAAEAQRRKDELRRVLNDLEGEPVYVEGVDGPAPRER